MMLAPDNHQARYVIRAYEPGRLQINEQNYSRPVLLTPQQLDAEALPTEWTALQAADIERLCTTEAEVILLGTGARQQFLPAALQAVAMRHQRQIDVMDTRAAAHTFVVLAAEGRRIVAALYP